MTYQEASWQAAVVGAILGVIQLILGLIRQARETRAARAKFGYELLDKLFADEWASDFLYSLDALKTGLPVKARRQIGGAFDAIFSGGGLRVPEEKEASMYQCLDAFLFFLDRFEHAIRAKLTTFETVCTPTGYYVRLLEPYRTKLQAYMVEVGYSRALAFLARYGDAWKGES